MTTWNHRVTRERDETNGSWWYAIREVFYDDDGRRISSTVNAVSPGGETIDDLRWELQRFLQALDKPVLDNENLTEVENENQTSKPTRQDSSPTTFAK